MHDTLLAMHTKEHHKKINSLLQNSKP